MRRGGRTEGDGERVSVNSGQKDEKGEKKGRKGGGGGGEGRRMERK